MKIAIVAGAADPTLSRSNACLADALTRQGVECPVLCWNRDPVSAFLDCDLALLRQSWDYQTDAAGYAAWLCRLEMLGGQVENPARLAIWNNDKRTLLQLAEAGVRVPGTVALLPDDGLPDAARRWDGIVLKPAFGGSGTGVRRCSGATLAAALAEVRAEAPGRPVMVQEYLPEIAEGEWKLICIDGALGFAVRALPQEGEFRVNSRFAPEIARTEPPEAARRAAEALIGWLGAPLYMRIDGVMRGSDFICTELELTDPDLFLDHAPEAAAALAAAAIARAGVARAEGARAGRAAAD